MHSYNYIITVLLHFINTSPFFFFIMFIYIIIHMFTLLVILYYNLVQIFIVCDSHLF